MKDPASISRPLASAGVWAVILGGMYLTTFYSFHLFHSLAELFSIVVACGIFMVAWNTRGFGQNFFLLFLGVAYLCVAVLDVLHLLTYQGMGPFPGLGPDPPIQFWIAARYLEALSLAAAPLLGRRGLAAGWLLAGYGALTAAVVLAVFGGWFPSCYQAGVGVTAFKAASEFVVAGLLALAIWLILRRRDLDAGLARLMVWACALTILAELSFSFYTTLFGFFNQAGHYLKIISFYLIYRATIRASLTRPYQVLFGELAQREADLRESEARNRKLFQNAAAVVVFVAPDLKVHEFNPGAQELFGWRREDILTSSLPEVLVAPASREEAKAALGRVLEGQEVRGLELDMQGKEGQERVVLWNATRMSDAAGQALGAILSGQDITQRKQAENDREALIRELEQALEEIRTLSGLLPICAQCKKVRDDRGYWQQIEAYVQEHSQARFSHGICPSCARQLYPELMAGEGDAGENPGESSH
jgi:hypothetical protein